MNSPRNESRSGSELVFASLRALMSAYQLWGAHSRCHLSELAVLLHTSEDWLWGVMAYLDAEGLVNLDRSAATVALTAEGARNLMVDSRSDAIPPQEPAAPPAPREVVVALDSRRPSNGSGRS
jgi:hypothetical protein